MCHAGAATPDVGPMSCSHSPAVRDDSGTALVCPRCATIIDPAYILLVDQGAPPTRTVWPPHPAWPLASHEKKQARNRKNEYVIAQMIKSIAASLTLPGLAPRAIHIFNQALAAGLRWGRQAKRAAGASVALALRDHNHPHHLHDIATLLDEPFPALSRAFLHIASLLGLTFKSSDPSIYISSLKSHLDTLLQDAAHNTVLLAPLLEQLRHLDYRSVVNTAYPLCVALTRTLGDASLTAPPTACAIFLLAIESEARSSLHNVSDLAHYLGAKYRIAKGTVMARYKLIQDQVASWIEQVPWLDKYTSKGGRAKVSRRTIVARGLKEALEYRQTQSTDNNLDAGTDVQQARKKRKLDHEHRSVSSFLLDPQGVPNTDVPFAALQETAPNVLSLSDVTGMQSLTRLQQLALERGGSDEARIPDDELFEEGELEGLFRTNDEKEALRPIFNYEAESTAEQHQPRSKRPGKNKCKAKQSTSRIDISAFEQFMGSNIEQELTDDDHPFLGVQLLEAERESNCLSDLLDDRDSDSNAVQSSASSQTESEIIVEQWKPLSPFWQSDAHDQYDNYYDD
ncbi:hypothetical protein APHAL10511_007060 [Amanita phalloides]|nr:hypothetical protein APHAL10511_007060 [Amanita phalloides]